MNNPSAIDMNLVIALGTAACSVLYGFAVWRLSRYFATKEAMEKLEKRVDMMEEHVTDLRIKTGSS